MRVVDQETGEALEDTRPPREPREPRVDRGDRSGDRRGWHGDRGPHRDGSNRPRRDREEGVAPYHMPAFLKADD